MKTNVAETSIETIHQMRDEGKTLKQRQKILLCLDDCKQPMTRGQVAKKTGIEKGSVAGRVNSLIKHGAIIETMKINCPISGRPSWLIKLSPDLFK